MTNTALCNIVKEICKVRDAILESGDLEALDDCEYESFATKKVLNAVQGEKQMRPF